VIRDQQLQDGQDRALTFPVTIAAGVSSELPLPSADLVLGWKLRGHCLGKQDAGGWNCGLLLDGEHQCRHGNR
jgi:hypothetical protein